MASIVALTITVGLIFALLYFDSKNGEKVSKVFWIFSIWFMIIGSRPLTAWSSRALYDNTLSGGTEGNPLNLISGLIFAGFAIGILVKRHINIGALFRQNLTFFALLLYCLISCTWSDYPQVSFRRWFRLVLVVLVVVAILSEPDKIAAIKKLFSRFAIFTIPLSITLIKYFPNLATSYSWSGGKMWTGVCTQKNNLGVALAACMLFYIWKWLILKDYSTKKADLFLFAVASYIMFNPLVKGSSTAILSLLTAILILVIIKLFRNKINQFAMVFYAIVCIYFATDLGVRILFHSSILKYVTLVSGRDMTFTGRTVIWDAVLEESNQQPVLGTGYGIFWSGNRLLRLDSKPLMKGIKQSHNGYIETYVNLGIIGVSLLIILLFISLNIRIKGISYDYSYNSLAIAFITLFILAEFFEATALSSAASRWVILLIFILNVNNKPLEFKVSTAA